MNKLLFLIAFSFIFQFNTFAQEAINNYKYIIIPNPFEFQKSPDQYQLNELTKFLFNKHGYEAYLDSEEFPEDLGANNCLALRAVVKDESSLLKTKIIIDLVDCKNNIIATSQVGSSKFKKRDKAYNQSIRGAFVTYEYFDYNYQPQSNQEPKVSPKVEEVVEDVAEPAKTSEKVLVAAELEVQSKEPVVQSEPLEKEDKELLYAQPIENGFQIVDTEPKKVMILLDTGVADTFIVKGKDAIVYKKSGVWMHAENNGTRLIVKEINLKF